MLSRIAESLFWIGRYVERSDGTARILDVHLQLLLEDPWIDEDAACRALLEVMGSTNQPIGALTRFDLLRILGLDRSDTSSIAYSLWAARENARRARDILPTELFETLNTTYNHLPNRLQESNAHEFFQWVRERSALTQGVIEASVSRDDTWRFMVLGRSLERLDMTARLLATRSLTEDSGPSWTTILRSCGGHEAYQRTYRGTPSTEKTAEFLLLDKLFPRSIMNSLTKAEDVVRGLEPTRARVGVGGDALRVLGQIRSELEYASIDEILLDLPNYMDQVQQVTLEVSELVRQRYFPVHVEPSWIGEIS